MNSILLINIQKARGSIPRSGTRYTNGYRLFSKSPSGLWDTYGTVVDNYLPLVTSLIAFHCIASFVLKINSSLSLLGSFVYDNCFILFSKSLSNSL